MKKLNISLLLIAIMILSMSVAFAADADVSSNITMLQADSDTLEIDSILDDVSQATDDAEVLTADTSKNFTVLQNEIDTATGPLFMTSDYKRVDGESDVSITKDITIIGNNNPTIDANNLGGIFNVQSGRSLTLMGVTLINGNSEYGGAIYNDGGSVNIVNSKFLNNTATKSGGAIYNNAGTLLVSGSTLSGNDLIDRSVNGYGGAAIYDNGGTVIITSSEITDNLKDIVHRGGTGTYTGDLSGAAVTTEHGTLSVSDSYFARNSGSYGGAILANGADATLNVEGTTFEDNFAFNGGAIYATDSKYTITNSNFKGNKVRGTGSTQTNYANGGAIAATESSDDCIISDCTFEDNSAAIGGAVSGKNTHIQNCTFINNTAKSDYSETFNGRTNNRGGMGGAVYSDAVMTITGSDFVNNTSRSDAVSVREATITDSSFTNTIIAPNRGPLTISNNTYDNAGDDIKGGNSPIIYFDGVGEIPKITGAKVYYDATGFADIQAMIDSGTTASIYLTGDVTKLDSEYETFANGISVNRSVSIYGEGHTITSDNGKVFNVASTGSLSLYNAAVVGDGNAAVVNDGTVTLGLTTTFANVGDYAIENNGRVSQSDLTTFTQLDNLIGLVNGGEVYIGSSKITKADDEKTAFADGIVIDKDVTVTGYYRSYYKRIDTEVNADNDGRIFNVADGATLTLNSIILKNGNAEKGGAVYVNEGAVLNADTVDFIDNTATYRGGAVYSEGTVNVDNSVFDKNDITFRTKNDDNGGAAIYNMKGTLNIAHTNITNSVKDIVIRNGNAGDLLVGVVVTTGDTLITDSYFANNTGSWGGAISSLGYMNDDAYTLTVKNTKFEGNNATFGGAIFVESAPLVVDNCTFVNNKGVGVGSSGTSNTQGGAIVVHPAGSSATITDSTFIANSANTGGAVSLAGVDQDSLIDNCTFTDNTASDGGAIYLWTQDDAAVTVEDSKFSGNTAGWGNAISTDGTLILSNNEVSSTTADIANYNGEIISEINVEIMENGTYSYHMSDITLTAVITDDNGNLIKDINFDFTIGDIGTVHAVFADGVYTGVYTPTAPGTYVVNITYETTNELKVKTATITISQSLTDLAKLIEDAESGDTITLDGDYTYIEDFDAGLENGIVINKDIIIDGKGKIISGSDLVRLFNVTSPYTLTLNNVTLRDAKADKGAAVYVNNGATLNTNYATFSNNTATYRGGAVYSEGTVNVDNSVFDKNDITFRTKNDDNGGAAIYNMKGTLNIAHTNITNSVKDIVIRNGNAGDLLVGVVVTTGDTLITDSYFANNTGSWGGAISSLGYMNTNPYTLTIENTKFEGNNATFGGAIFVESSDLVVDNCTFVNNKGVGVGSSGTSNTQGGAIVVHPAGSSATITDSTFIANSANTGGAVSLAGVDQDSLIDNCTFTDNTASDGGAIYLWTQDDAAVTVKDSKFSGNTAGWGNAISTDGTLILSNNEVSSTTADIANYGGEIISEINVVILDNETVDFAGEILITAKVTDDNNNLIKDINFDFDVNGTIVHAVFNATSGLYQGTYTNDVLGVYVANMTYPVEENLIVKTATLRNIKGTFTDLAGKITDAILYHDGVLNLTYDFAYTPDIDEVYIEGILIQGTSLLTVNGNNHTISGSKLAGIFNIQLENATTFNNITFANAYAGAVLTTSKLIVNNCAFINNTDYYDGGYDEGGAISSFTGELVITDSVFINNTARDGGAIDVEGANVTLTNCVFTDNKAVGDGIDSGTGGAISAGNTEQTLTVNNCVFTNNIASTSAVSPEYAPKGGAISSSGHVIINNSNFTNNSADYGGAIEFAFASAEISNSNFTDNTAVYRGGAIYSESTLNVDHCVFDRNDITFRTRNDDNGGAAIYNLNGTLTINNTNITNSVKDIVIRNGNAGDLLVGVVVTTGDTLINNSYFANNTGSWGGAISSLGYMNTNPYTLTIENTKFEGNNATFGGAIFVESSDLVVDNCTFVNNKGVGVGSSGTSNTQGGAIVVHPAGSSATITDSTFIANSANTGGAVSLAGVDQNSLIDNCTFTDNTASDGGAIYLWTQDDAAVTVKDSKFSGNTAGWGNAISTDGTLILSNNEVSSTSADIANYGGTIISEINVEIMENGTYSYHMSDITLTAVITDDNGNLIKDINFDFTVGDIGTVHAVFADGVYTGVYTPTAPGTYIVNITYETNDELVIKTATITISRSLIDLDKLVEDAEDGETITLDGDYAYIAEFDAGLENGIVIDKNIIINGKGANINGSDLVRLFNVTSPYTLTLNNVTLRDAKADKGAAVYVNEGATLNTDYVTFTNNSATYRGGAIYSEGTVNVDHSVFDKNDITFRTKNDDNGGAAIYNLNGTLTINNTNITNSVKDIVIRNGNAGDLLVGVVVTTGDTLINNSYFANNTGSWGGAISSLGYMNTNPYTLTIENTKFEGNNATFGGAIFVESSNLVVDNCTFTNNKGVGVGSSGTSNTQGGAIVVFPSGAKATITDSTFIANSANLGGAVSLAGVDQDSLIDNCTFTDNTASSEGGAIYLWTDDDAVVTVEDSKFSGNTAPWGNAISSDGTLALSKNTVSSTTADIANYYGTVITVINATVLGNTTVPARIGDELTLTAKVTDDNGNLIRDINFQITVDGVPLTTKYISGLYQANYTVETAGPKIVNMTYISTDNLVTYIGILDVPKNNATLIVTTGQGNIFAFGDNITVFISLYDNETLAGLTENITVIINDTEVPVEVINGVASFNITGFEPGQYAVTGMFNGNINYNGPIYASSVFNVLRPDRILSIEVEDIIYGQMAVINITVTDYKGVKEEGIVVLNISGREFTLIVNGTESIEISDLAVGEYSINATLVEKDLDAAVINDTESFNVGKAPSSVEIITVVNATYPKPVFIIFDVGNETEINIEVSQDGIPVIVPEITRYDSALYISGLGVGVYTINITNVGNENYAASSDSALFEITQATPVIEVSAVDVTYPGDVVVTVTSDVAGEVTVIVGDKNATETVEAGVAKNFTLSGLAANEEGYVINATLAESANYTAGVNDTETVKVMKATVTITPEIEGKLYGEDVTITVTLPEDATGNVTIVVDDTIVARDLPVSNGTVEFNVSGLSAGPHDYTVAYSGDDNYEVALDTGSFEIAKAEGKVNATVEAGTADDPVNITVTGPSDANGIVLVTIDGKNVTFAQMKDGSVVIPISGLGGGPHNLTVTYLGDDNYGNASYTTSFDIEENPTNTTISVVVDRFDVEITVNVTSTSLVNEGTVTLTFNNQNTTAVVDNGVAVFKFTNLDAKNYTIVASYDGTSTFLPSNATGSANVKRISAYLKPVYEPFIFNYGHLYKFRLVDKEGNPIAGRTVEFSVHSKVYYVKTDKDGWGQIQLTTQMLIHADKIFSRLIFRGDTQYKPATYAVWFNAMQEPAKLSNVKAVKSSYKVSESNKQVTATLKDSKGKVIAGKQVSITINGKTIKAKTNNKGVVTFNLNGVSFSGAGTVAFIVAFEDVNYKRTTFKSVINIVKD